MHIFPPGRILAGLEGLSKRADWHGDIYWVQSDSMKTRLEDVYARLYAHFGPRHWWPSKGGAFEIIVGAILTQNTAWTNVEKAMTNLRRERLLSPSRLHGTRRARLARLIHPSGCFNVKAKKLHAFTAFLFEKHRGSLRRLFALEVDAMRGELLAVYGIGPETADSIILYAAHKPIFVVDAYTRRVFARLGLTRENASYDELQGLFHTNLEREERLFNEYHALVVAVGKHMCSKSKPKCGACPLREICPTGKRATGTD